MSQALPTSAENRTDLRIQVAKLDRLRSVVRVPSQKFRDSLPKRILGLDIRNPKHRVDAAKRKQRIAIP